MRSNFLQELAQALAMNAEAQQALIEAQQQNAAAVQQAAAAQVAIAQALTRIASAQGEASPWVDKHQAAELLNCYPEQLKRWRVDWIEGVHYTKSGYKYLYNAPLILNWRLNRDRPQEHQAEIERWVLQQRAS